MTWKQQLRILLVGGIAVGWAGLTACGASVGTSGSSGDEPASRVGASPFCPERSGDCDRDPENGCETDLSFDVANCGLCSQSCDRPNYESMCVDGRCSGRCALYYCDADGDPANGCERGPLKEKEPSC